jgi:hypothetical protein
MRKNLTIIALSVAFILVGLYSFKSASADVKKVTILKHYSSSEAEFNNAIVICTPDGKTKKWPLLQHKKDNFELNDKMLAQQLNALLETGLKITSIESYGDRQLFITTYILE